MTKILVDREVLVQVLKDMERAYSKKYEPVVKLRALLDAPSEPPHCPDCHAPGLLYECVYCGANNYPPKEIP